MQLWEDVKKSGPDGENSNCRDSEIGTYLRGQGGWSVEGHVALR